MIYIYAMSHLFRKMCCRSCCIGIISGAVLLVHCKLLSSFRVILSELSDVIHFCLTAFFYLIS